MSISTPRPTATTAPAPATTATATQSQRLVAAAGAMLLGAFLVYFAGFSHIDAVHNAAHDTRHSSAFPCH
ncbi:CbtB-domain containing protein [Pseudomonas lutea]|jgi:cobalt transporter subunit CbtB|uniref:CbtB-domain containing protein n=1 Tax=Pseudomonas lutea TaxID=243924 RepID=A0ABR9A4J5_9PSED|nr:CbtB-domain containing protein [Pseudomonas lutea]MBD8120741.1 CbtB-domain containing protein [Pseudomonas lutea]